MLQSTVHLVYIYIGMVNLTISRSSMYVNIHKQLSITFNCIQSLLCLSISV